MRSRRKKLILVLGLFFLLVLLSAILISVPFFLNPQYLKEVALQQIQQTFGPHISIGQTTLSLFPNPRVEVFDVVVKERPDTHAVFRTKFMSLEFGIGPLLRQQVVVQALNIHQPEIEIKRNREGQWRTFEAISGQTDISFLGNLLLIKKVAVSKGHVVIIDESPIEEVRGIVLTDVDIGLISSEENGLSVDLELSGRIRRQSGDSEFSLEGRIAKTSLGTGPPQIASQETFPQLKFLGQVAVSNLDIQQVARFLQEESLTEKITEVVNLRSRLRLIPGQMGYELFLSELLVESESAVFSGDANIAGLATGDPTIFVTFNSTPVALDKLQEVIPLAWIPEDLGRLWNQAELRGTVQATQATMVGSTRSDVGMSVVGNFYIENGYLYLEDVWPQTQKIKGRIIVEPDRIRFVDFTGIYDSVPVSSAEATVLFKEYGPWMEAEFRGDVPGGKVLAVLEESVGSNILPRAMHSWKVSEGSGFLMIRFEGIMNSPEGVAFERGEYVAQGLRIHIPEWEKTILDGGGIFRFSPDKTEFDSVSGWVGQSPFQLNGTIKTSDEVVFDVLRFHADLQVEELTDALNLAWEGPKPILGGIELDLLVSGPVQTPKISGEVDLVNSSVQLSGLVEKVEGLPGTIEFEARVLERGMYVIDRMELLILPLRLAGKGRVTLDPTFTVQGRLNSGSIYLGLLPEGLTIGEGVLQSGILEVSLELHGRGTDWRNWQPSGWIALTEGLVVSNELDWPVRNLYLRIKVDPDVTELKRVEFRVQESDARLTGSIKHWKTTPEINFALESLDFDIDLVIPKGERSPLRDFLEALAANSSVVGTVNIEHPWYKNLEFRNLSCELRIHDGLVTVDKIRAESEGQPLAGRVFVHLPEKKPAAVRASFDVKGIRFEQLRQSVGQEERLVTGDLSLRGRIQGNGRDPRGVLPTVNGQVDVTIEKGLVRQGTIIPKILKILNLYTVLKGEVDLDRQGFPFETATGSLIITDGVVTSNDIVVDSPIMKMSTAGTYEMEKDHLQAVSAVSPFGGYSDFMKTIPLFGRILKGERKGIATALFQVEGSLEDPEIIYMPLKSLATGLTGLAKLAFDVLFNTVMLPGDLLNSAEESMSSNSTDGEVGDGVSDQSDMDMLVSP